MVRKSYKLAGLKHTAQLKLFHPFLHSCSVMLQQEQPEPQVGCGSLYMDRFYNMYHMKGFVLW